MSKIEDVTFAIRNGHWPSGADVRWSVVEAHLQAAAILESQARRIQQLEGGLARQTENMAFLLNYESVPDQWYRKFNEELHVDRGVLKDKP